MPATLAGNQIAPQHGLAGTDDDTQVALIARGSWVTMNTPLNLDGLSVLHRAAEDMSYYDGAVAELLRHALNAAIDTNMVANATDQVLIAWADELRHGMTPDATYMVLAARRRHPDLREALDAMVRVVPMHPDDNDLPITEQIANAR